MSFHPNFSLEQLFFVLLQNFPLIEALFKREKTEVLLLIVSKERLKNVTQRNKTIIFYFLIIGYLGKKLINSPIQIFMNRYCYL